jgi:transcription termination factor NusB
MSKFKQQAMWNNTFRTCVFFAVYQSIFNKSIGIEHQISDYVGFLDTIKEEYPDLFIEGKQVTELTFDNRLETEFQISKIDQVIAQIVLELEPQMDRFYLDMEEMTDLIKDYLSDWTKTFGIVRAILFCFIMEKKATANNQEFETKSIGLYIKLAEEFTILANIKLIHAILSKLHV